MKELIIAIICLFFVSITYAQDNAGLKTGNYLKQDDWESDRMNVHDKTGRKTGEYMKADTWEPNKRYNFYDENGQRTGTYLEQDPWEPDRYNFKTDP